MAKRTLDSFFKPVSPPSPKRSKPEISNTEPQPQSQLQPQLQSASQSQSQPSEPTLPPNTHPTYPIPIPQLPQHILVALQDTPSRQPRQITNQPHLDLLHFQPYIPRKTANELFKFLRAELPFYRVQYTIKRGGIETNINTPRYTTVFGIDDTHRFTTTTTPTPTPSSTTESPESPEDNEHARLQPVPIHPQTKTTFQYPPRPIPTCLDELRKTVEAATGTKYNFCLVNYYASGEDSISFHSDDERFLGDRPNIASLSLGGEREFQMKHKPVANETPLDFSGTGGHGGTDSGSQGVTRKQGSGSFLQMQTQARSAGQSGCQLIKMPLGSGDMVVMRGDTQANWLHSIPKRRGKAGDAVRGRMNITFRRAVVPAGTNNYYHYNVGSGPVYRWDEGRGVMDLMKSIS